MPTISSKQQIDLERTLCGVRASFPKRFIVTLMDLLYIIAFNLPLFVIIAYWKPSETLAQAFKGLIDPSRKIEAWRLLIFSLWIFFCCYIYFVLIASKTKFQTLFSNNFGLKAINIHTHLAGTKNKISQKQMFVANFVPVFLLPLSNIIFFTAAWIISSDNPAEWSAKIKEQSSPIGVFTQSALSLLAFFQIHHLCTVSASRKTINWLVKSNGIIYVDSERYELLLLSEQKPLPSKEKIFVNMPGVEPLEYESIRENESPQATQLLQESVPVNK